ncbi:MAG: hypothetical protein MK142_08160, partial [Pseudomonadales bacterium]|nr:hypothetical protein [Pseudomonadales bacterium]
MLHAGLRSLLLSLLALCTTSGFAGDTAPAESVLTIERVYGSPELSGPRPRALRFSPDGTRITFLRPKAEDRMTLDLWAMDVDAGAPYRLVDARALAPQERALSEAEIQSRER